MSPGAITNGLRLLAVAGVPGVIVSSINDSTGGAVSFGLLTVLSATALILVAAATDGPINPFAATTAQVDDPRAEAVERRIAALVAQGADEDAVRSLVREAVHLGRESSPTPR